MLLVMGDGSLHWIEIKAADIILSNFLALHGLVNSHLLETVLQHGRFPLANFRLLPAEFRSRQADELALLVQVSWLRTWVRM